MIIMVYSAVDAGSIEEHLGESEYSYYYVLKEFLNVLKRFGIVVVVHDPEKEVDTIYHNAKEHGQDCVFISFTPPHKTCTELECPTIPALAWEFSTIPTESWLDDPKHDWRFTLGKLGMAITHSQFAVKAVKKAMGESYSVFSLPAPVWDRCVYSPSNPLNIKPFEINFAGSVADTDTADLEPFSPIYDGMPERRYIRNKFVAKRHPISLTLDGVLYFSVFNPKDGRKNWADMLDGFVTAHREHADATLVLKLVNNNVAKELRGMLRILHALKPYKCRVVILQGYIPDEEYLQLQKAMHFVVNTSLGEGQCLPLMELMSMGKPAIAPYHSSMLDYVTPDNTFIVDSSQELTFWPQDPRRAYRTMRSRIDAMSVVKAFSDSYDVIKNNPEKYNTMCQAAHSTMHGHCSENVIADRLAHLFSQHPRINLQDAVLDTLNKDSAQKKTSDSELAHDDIDEVAALAALVQSHQPQKNDGLPQMMDSRLCGLKDANHSGWFNQETGELVPNFKIVSGDKLVDIGCGDGPSSLFAAKQGADVTFIDIEADKVNTLQEKMAHMTVDTNGIISGAETLPLPNECATKIVAREVLEHLENPQQAMQELARIGKSGALYLLTVPEATAENMLKSVGATAHFEKPNHIQIFDKESFAKLVTDAGLIIEDRQYYGFFWSMWMNFMWSTNEHPNEGATLDNINPPYPLLASQWAETWSHLLDIERADEVKGAMDELLPKSQIIIARKP